MRRREFISLIGGVTATWPLAVHAQQPMLPVVGLLRTTEAAELFIAAFRRGLSDSGYTDGTNVTLDIRVADGKRDRLSELAADLVRKRVAVLSPTPMRHRMRFRLWIMLLLRLPVVEI
jgi:putative ABC transport system substrate-binding protein